ncbi:MAG TPA: hypothetical protein VFY61_07615, partial [Pyrinomonadaceae bacterium]|nr:hypothetical protein [Pyrinomonadaceae bacterium]
MSTKQKIAAQVICLLLLFTAVGQVMAQQPSPSPAPKTTPASTASTGPDAPVESGENAGDYTVISSIEFGYRGLSVDGDLNKYKSDLNYRTGPRLFDSTFLL